MTTGHVDPAGFQVAGSAPDYYERYVSLMMAPFVEAVVAKVAAGPGMAVLDIACGTGFVARAAAARVGPGGRVVGSDVNPAMLALAERTAPDTQPAIEWVEASALDLPFEDGEFDAVTGQQGIQFFPDLESAAREMARVLRPGGRVAASFFAPDGPNPYLTATIAALGRVLDARVLQQGVSLAAERAAEAFRSAGLRDVRVERVTATVTLPPAAEFVPVQTAALPVAGAFAALDPDTRAAAVQEAVEALAPYAVDGGMRVPFTSDILSAVR